MKSNDLMLDFISWGYKTPKPLRAGTKRRIAREDAHRKFLADLYAKTPNYPPSRQVRRRLAMP